MEKIILLANNLYESQPLLKGCQVNYESELYKFSKDEKIDLLVYCFKKYDRAFNQSLILYYINLWEDFIRKDWVLLITKMFPREKFNKHSFKDINSGWYCDILLLNGIIGINPFELIFNDLEISSEEKKLFFYFFKHRGEYSFYINERELIEDIVNYYDLEVFQKIVIMKEKLIQEGFTPTVKYVEIIEKYSSFYAKHE
ncbi:hypothetical protein IUY40_19010 [Flavobacterium sp. ALJ2]|uniref:hypothetical protein n=1 Tax=Flavobacterium sp. ALJ2 TaxID=2786960 RepID=UPI0018A11C85|nr:hypothetical protein [Flavobacterium sp. ALJ2]MBF7093616.1 hypothetical protein [Flavobacterium sp. ALJ2]